MPPKGTFEPNLAEDTSERYANRLLDQFGLQVSEAQFERLCDVFDLFVEARGSGLDATQVCHHISLARLPNDVAAAALLVLLKDPFRRLRARVVEQATLDRMLG